MLKDLFQQIDDAYPWLSRWLGGRLDIQLPAISLSVLTHGVILMLFGMLTYAASGDRSAEIEADLIEVNLEDFAVLDHTEIQMIEETVMTPSAASAGPTIVPRIVTSPSGIEAVQDGPELVPRDLALANHLVLPTATRLDQSVIVRGTGAEHVEDVEGAVDRIAIEILRRLETGPTLVVWAFDASGSLLEERSRLGGYIGDVYTHIARADRQGLAADDGLLTAVVAFGKDRRVMAEPTGDVSTITQAIAAVPLDETGIENTFQTVVDIAGRYGRFKTDGRAYGTMTVIVTDEVGDDEQRLEPAIAAVRAARMPVYVLGSPALFGRVEGYMDYTDPKTDRTYRRLPVQQGPESVEVEMVKLPFWYAGPQFDLLDSGFGFWGLSRLASQSGGIYFISRLGTASITFDPAGMREYQPDWSSREQILARHRQSPLRQAVVAAGQITQQNLPEQPPLTFPAADSPRFKEVMARYQETVARIQYTVDEALVPITAALPARDREEARRWRAHYDLIRGRLLAIKLRCYEYNFACAQMKKELPKPFSDPKYNAWRLVPDGTIRSSNQAGQAAEVARDLLETVAREHPGSPWALLARRELKDPFGFRWVEVTVPPPPPRDANGGNNRPNNNRNAPPPAPPPKL